MDKMKRMRSDCANGNTFGGGKGKKKKVKRKNER